MPVKNIYITTTEEFEVRVENNVTTMSLFIKDDKHDASSKSVELVFDRNTIKKLAEEIIKQCNGTKFGTKLKL
jgi:hypothetical protein